MLFPPFDPAAVTAEIDATSICDGFGIFVPFGLLQSDNVKTSCSTGSQQGVDVADTVNAIDSCCTNVEHAERELVQPRPQGGLPHLSLPPLVLPSKCPLPFVQFQVSTPSGSCLGSSDVWGVALPPRLDFSTVDTFSYMRVISEYISSLCLGFHVFRGGGIPTWHGCRGKRFRFVGMHHHQSILLVGLYYLHRRVLMLIDFM